MDKGPVKQTRSVSPDFIRQLAGYGLTTAEIRAVSLELRLH